MDSKNVVPDETVLKQVFPDRQSTNFNIILHNWDKCIFKLVVESDADREVAYIVRLEAERENLQQFMTVATIEKIAASVLPQLVPKTFKTGRASNALGRIFQFSVTEFVDGDLLEDVWENITSQEERISIAADLSNALSKLHAVRLGDKVVKEALRETVGDQILLEKFGGPHTGFLDSGSALLYSIFERRKLERPFCTLDSSPEGIQIKSSFENIGSVDVSSADMESWVQEAGLCHNDLNPRNIILRKNDKSQYSLAAVIDWELSGFYPASFQLSLQDTYLGSANRHTSFYALLKEQMKVWVPPSSSQIALLRAMELIYESQQRYLVTGNNVGALIRKRFLEHSNLKRDGDPYTGWTRNPAESSFEYSGPDFDELQNAVIKEVMEARAAKSKAS